MVPKFVMQVTSCLIKLKINLIDDRLCEELSFLMSFSEKLNSIEIVKQGR